VSRGCATLLLWAFATGAGAQISGSASGVSDYRYRGITFSDRMPAAQGGLTYDDPIGWYAGVFGSTVRMAPSGGSSSNFQTIVYAGYAKRLASGISVEAGGDYSAFAGAKDIDYGEVFLGAATERLSARIYYSPGYFGQPSHAVYGEINAVQPMVDRVRLVLHAGFQRYRYERVYGSDNRAQYTQQAFDARFGLRVDFEVFQLELAWVGVSAHDAARRITGSSNPNTAVVTLSHSF
jgi:uncharacterized protein (TIGR02001 family)